MYVQLGKVLEQYKAENRQLRQLDDFNLRKVLCIFIVQ